MCKALRTLCLTHTVGWNYVSHSATFALYHVGTKKEIYGGIQIGDDVIRLFMSQKLMKP